MADDNKISVDVTINSDGQKKIDQFAKSFDSLRSSINGLSQPFNSFSTNLNTLDKNLGKYTESLKNLNTQNKEFVSTGDQVGKKATEASGAFASWIGVFNTLGIASKSLIAGLSGGLSLIIAFLPEIINFATGFFKGKEAVNAMALSFKNLNDARKNANADAAIETTKLQLLYRSATDVNNAHEDRIKSIKTLQQEYPQHFKGLKEEDFLNGKAKTSFDAVTRSILENARAKSALNKITEEANKIADAEYQIEKIKNANNNEKKRAEREVAARPVNPRELAPKVRIASLQKESDERAAKAIAEQQQLIKFSKYSVDSLTKFAGGNNALAKVIAQSSGGYESAPQTYTAKNPKPKKPKPQKDISINDKPREAEVLEEAKSAGVNIKTDKTGEQQKQDIINLDQFKINATIQTQQKILEIEKQSAKEKAEAEEASVKSKIHAGDKFIDAALKNSKKDSAIFKAAFLAKKATSIADTIISTKEAVMKSFGAYASIPFVGQALGIVQAAFMAGQGAISIAEIAKQKPGFALGGQFVSDGRGALLSGYSRTDNTNAYLRSGEAVVVSEAMRDF